MKGNRLELSALSVLPFKKKLQFCQPCFFYIFSFSHTDDFNCSAFAFDVRVHMWVTLGAAPVSLCSEVEEPLDWQGIARTMGNQGLRSALSKSVIWTPTCACFYRMKSFTKTLFSTIVGRLCFTPFVTGVSSLRLGRKYFPHATGSVAVSLPRANSVDGNIHAAYTGCRIAVHRCCAGD